MLRSGLLHPPLLAALAGAGHGSQVLIADALYPHDTGANPSATRIHLNLRPGLVAARDVLELVSDSCYVESALFMEDADGQASQAVREYQEVLAGHRHWGGQEVGWSGAERFAFYEACQASSVSVVIATGEVRPYSNLLVTIGVP